MSDVSEDRQNLELAVYAAVRAGARILEVYNQSNVQTEYKADNSPLTEADTASHQILTDILSGSHLPILSEEGENPENKERLSWDRFWMIDPLDGTKEFLKRNGEFTINVALISDRHPVTGVVYVPVSGDLYFASNIIGSYKVQLTYTGKNDLPDLIQMINLAEKLPFATTRNFTVVASRSHRNEETELFIRQLEKEHRNVTVVSKGSALKICIVAEGNADIYPRFGPTMEWDTAAGQCLAINAGCTVTRNDTGEMMYYNKTDLLNPWFIVKR
ncbi:MAG: 3'(2'),5'-bisphosphate nucleotidase CysQ [Bacteroidales bacterium]|nr:3'(2'),5'-bisphosphate nucleotidase CysQ [Bacteroidales bacterium]